MEMKIGSTRKAAEFYPMFDLAEHPKVLRIMAVGEINCCRVWGEVAGNLP
jgi:hypothetical protein